MRFLVLAVMLAACGPGHRAKIPEAVPDLDGLEILYAANKSEAYSIRDRETGWLTRDDCDGMIWAAKADIALGGTNIEAAEYPGEPGKFGRRPPPWCWTPEGGDQGAQTEWSRDMAIAGLMPWAWLTKRRDILERHAAYGRSHDWLMGDPIADGRAYYTPAVRGLLAKAIISLGGDASPDALWPSVWPAYLTGYEAHLQVMSIWLQGEVAAAMGEADALPAKRESAKLTVDISNEMFSRLEEHASREPSNPLYSYVLGRYTGHQDGTVAILTASDMPVGDYVRCGIPRQCQLAEWLWVASLVLRDFGRLP